MPFFRSTYARPSSRLGEAAAIAAARVPVYSPIKMKRARCRSVCLAVLTLSPLFLRSRNRRTPGSDEQIDRSQKADEQSSETYACLRVRIFYTGDNAHDDAHYERHEGADGAGQQGKKKKEGGDNRHEELWA